jgi:hypothetical protein
MLDLPDFSRPFYYENNFNLSSDVNRLAKIMAHYELFKLSIEVPGDIVECGVFKGSSLIRFTTFRQLLGNPVSKKVIGFDIFGQFPDTEFILDKKPRQKFVADSDGESISEEQLIQVLKHKGIEQNVELVKGDVNVTIPHYVKDHPYLRISLLNIDVDVYEPTKTALECLYPLVVNGGIIILDDYCGLFPGANKAVEDYLKHKKHKIKRFPFCVSPCYLIKQV